MISFPNAKINLGLQIVERRPDGYHNLETVFYPIPVEDALEITELKESPKGKCLLKLSGRPVEGNPDDNLVVRAYRLLCSEFDLPHRGQSTETHPHGCRFRGRLGRCLFYAEDARQAV